MPRVVNRTGNAEIDGLLWGWAWDAGDFTFSFPRSAGNYQGYARIGGFQAFNGVQKTAVREILNQIESFCHVTFTEISPGRGIATHRFAEAGLLNYTNDPSLTRFPGPRTVFSAEANPPESPYKGNPPLAPLFSQGDSWYNRADYNHPRPGSFAYAAGLMHETGHNLGLKHGHTRQFSHGIMFPKLPANHNSYEYSVMTYAQFVGDNPRTPDDARDHPTTYMQNDIRALQYLYGANYNHERDDTTYRWDPRTGEAWVDGVGQGQPVDNCIFMTVWDGGGTDTYDFSNYAYGVRVDLRPGAWSSTTRDQLANLGSDDGDPQLARGSIANAQLHRGDPRSLIENVVGGSGNDRITGNAANNRLDAGAGSDVLEGLGGADAFLFTSRLDARDVDRIVDFAPVDTIVLNDAIFRALDPGALSANAFRTIAAAGATVSREDHVLYDRSSGKLFYDADGGGASGRIAFADLDNQAALTNRDILVV